MSRANKLSRLDTSNWISYQQNSVFIVNLDFSSQYLQHSRPADKWQSISCVAKNGQRAMRKKSLHCSGFSDFLSLLRCSLCPPLPSKVRRGSAKRRQASCQSCPPRCEINPPEEGRRGQHSESTHPSPSSLLNSPRKVPKLPESAS